MVIDTFEFGSKFTPRFNTISISGYHIREAGSTALQELAFTIYDGVEYVEWARRRGLDVDDFGPRLSFFFNAHNDFFEEIAKYRAARKIWYRLMKERFGAKNDRTRLLRFHSQTAGVSLPAQQPMNNIARVALQALAAVLGGTQSLHTDAYDEALALPTEAAARIALRTQQIVAFESGVAQTVDPLGGSYFVEKQTRSKPSSADTPRKKLPRPVTSTSARLKPTRRSRSASTISSSKKSRPTFSTSANRWPALRKRNSEPCAPAARTKKSAASSMP
jgi:methylmalonyl-CoA mutase, N-terminal domain